MGWRKPLRTHNSSLITNNSFHFYTKKNQNLKYLPAIPKKLTSSLKTTPLVLQHNSKEAQARKFTAYGMEAMINWLDCERGFMMRN